MDREWPFDIMVSEAGIAGSAPYKSGNADIWARLKGYRLTTAEILYHMPDHHSVLQTFVWQKHDLAPRFPELTGFLDFWQKEINGPLHSVRVAVSALVHDKDLRYYSKGFALQ